eukprot:4795618-Pyramimonas_sp.AAC.1
MLEVTTFDRRGRQVGPPRVRPMRPDPWMPQHAILKMFSASIGSSRARLHARAWPLPAGADGGEGTADARPPPPLSPRGGCSKETESWAA